MTARRARLVAMGLLALVPPVRAQGSSPVLVSGLEWRTVSFERLPSATRVRQLSAPVGLEIPLGRLTVDVGTAWVRTVLTRRDGTGHTVSDLTDTQIRATYELGRDAVVATLVANLPTGPERATPLDYSVIGSVSPSFLAFPVPVYASGLSVVGGLAGAVEAGIWSLGLAASLKVSDEFTPYEDLAGPITFRPGLEGRIRAGADGLLGSTQVTLGVTWSTFGTDEFGEGGAVSGQYQPGRRFIVEGAMTAPLGSSSLSISIWNYHRAAGDTSRISVSNRENLTGGVVSLSIPAGPSVVIEPRVEGRVSKPESGRGRWIGGGLATRFRLSDRVTLQPSARYDSGSLKDPNGLESGLSGGEASVFLRVHF